MYIKRDIEKILLDNRELDINSNIKGLNIRRNSVLIIDDDSWWQF